MKDGINLNTVICKECALVYTNPVPENDIYNKFYTEAYNDFYINWPPVAPEGCPQEMKQTIQFISTHLSDKNCSILEIGSGGGGFLYWLQQTYANAIGIEPGPNIIPAIEQFGLRAVHGFFETHDFGNSKYDALVMIHVFEHFYDINATLSKCRSILKDDGYLFIEAPNIHDPFRSLDDYFLRYVHPINYSEETMETMLLKHGFKSVYKKTAASSPVNPRNMFVIAQKTDSREARVDAGDYKRTLRILWLYRIQWLLCLRYVVLFQTAYLKTKRRARKLLLGTELGIWLKHHVCLRAKPIQGVEPR